VRVPSRTAQFAMADDPVTVSTWDGPGVVEERVPLTVTGPIHRVLGADVSDVTVRRGSDITALTHRLGARGFTEDRVVYVPDDVGALDSSAAAPLLAHELTHVVQQRVFGAALPDRNTHLGRQLEEDAVRVEDWMAGGAVSAPPTLVHPAAAGQQPPGAGPGAQRASAKALRALLDSSAMTEMPRMDARHLIDEFERANNVTALTPEASVLPELTVDALLRTALANDEPDTDDDGPGGGGKEPAGGRAAMPGDAESVAAIAEAVADLFADEPPRRWFDLDDVEDFEELAGRVYHELITRLRFDMVVDRERAGTLLDFA